MIPILRGLALVAWTYGLMAAMGLVTLPIVTLRPTLARGVTRLYVRLVLGGARLIAGMTVEIRGEPPEGEALVASKHQSFLDVMLMVHALDRPRYVMKKSLLWAPILGFYARRIGCVAIDRSKGGEALRAMLSLSAKGLAEEPGQLIIYPQGTRVAPGDRKPYRAGAGALYVALEQGCVPAATNCGVFWPRKGLARHPGTAVLEFLPPIPPGLDQAEMLQRLEAEVEAASDRLLDEARQASTA
ncbi:MAG: lysophospholipid acyltransferase family protein [Pseudomonadota bacterium]